MIARFKDMAMQMTKIFSRGSAKAGHRGLHRLAVAAAGGVDVLLSWNFQDIVNEKKMPEIKAVVERAGYRCPLFVSPKDQLEVMP